MKLKIYTLTNIQNYLDILISNIKCIYWITGERKGMISEITINIDDEIHNGKWL